MSKNEAAKESGSSSDNLFIKLKVEMKKMKLIIKQLVKLNNQSNNRLKAQRFECVLEPSRSKPGIL